MSFIDFDGWLDEHFAQFLFEPFFMSISVPKAIDFIWIDDREVLAFLLIMSEDYLVVIVDIP